MPKPSNNTSPIIVLPRLIKGNILPRMRIRTRARDFFVQTSDKKSLMNSVPPSPESSSLKGEELFSLAPLRERAWVGGINGGHIK